MKKTFDKEASSIVKGVAIIMLLVHHCFLNPKRYTGYPVNFYPITQDLMNLIGPYFKVCVGIFAFITGYGITVSMKKLNSDYQFTSQEATRSCLKRYLSLMSGYWFIFFLTRFLPFGLASERMGQLYGDGISKYLYMLFDFLGLASLYKGPISDSTWWYMCLAISIIFAMPALLRLYKVNGILLYLLFLLIPRGLGINPGNVTRWFPIVILGIICADTNLLDKLKAFTIGKHVVLTKVLKLVITSALLILFMYYRNDAKTANYRDLWDGIVPFFFVYFSFEFLTDIPVLKSVLNYLGKHSMNIFLIHTFLREYYYQPFFYQFKYAVVIVLVLLVCSLVLSILIEWAKKITRYNVLTNYVIKKIDTIPFP